MHGRTTQALIASTPVTFFFFFFYCCPLKKNTIVFLNRVIWKSTVNTCLLGNMVRDRVTAATDGSVWSSLNAPCLVICLILLKLMCLVVPSERSVNTWCPLIFVRTCFLICPFALNLRNHLKGTTSRCSADVSASFVTIRVVGITL